MREIVLDTETTGLDPLKGAHRVVEIGCLELINHLPTGARFHAYLNPERDMPEEAFRVHGLSADFLAKHPTFAQKADEFLAFVGGDPLVIHNARFDMGFINAELARIGRPPLPRERAIDTMLMAQRKYPGAQASLDALCRRFNIDASARTLHGALLDATLLAEVYLELIGGREPGFELAASARAAAAQRRAGGTTERAIRPARPHAPTAEESAAHAALLATIKDAIWSRP